MKPTSLLYLIAFCCSLNAHYFYQAQQPLMYQRYERTYLFTIDTTLSHGSCTTAHDNNKNKTNILGLYGKEQMLQVGKNVPNQDLTNLNTLIVDALWHQVSPGTDYATLECNGDFSSFQGECNIGFNLTDSFFITANVPFYTINIKNPEIKDSTPTTLSNVEWQAFIAHFDSILADAQLSKQGYKKSGIGDIFLGIGWVRNVEEVSQLWSFDTIIQLGCLLGNAEKQNSNQIFSIAPANNKHKGVFFSFDTHIGVTESLMLSIHAEQSVFFKRNGTRRVRTAEGQNGWIKLAQTEVNEEWGNKHGLGGYITYFLNDAFSVMTGYTYYHQNKHVLVPADSVTFSSAIMNGDPLLRAWSMHTWHIQAELNGNNITQSVHPRLVFSYNRIIQSRNTFLNHSASGTFGLAITADF